MPQPTPSSPSTTPIALATRPATALQQRPSFLPVDNSCPAARSAYREIVRGGPALRLKSLIVTRRDGRQEISTRPVIDVAGETVAA